MGRDGKMGGHLDVPANGFAGRLEVIEGPTGRRQRTHAEKARIVAESLMPGVRVADVARKYGATRWQVYDWRKRLRRQARLALPESAGAAPAFAAVVVEDAPRRHALALPKDVKPRRIGGRGSAYSRVAMGSERSWPKLAAEHSEPCEKAGVADWLTRRRKAMIA